MLKDIENIIFDFDGVLVDSLDDLFKLHNSILGPLNKEEFSEFFLGNSLAKGHNDYGAEKMNRFFVEWEKVFDRITLRNDTIDFLKENSDKNFFIVTSNTKINILKALENSKVYKNIFKKILGKEDKHCKTEKISDLKKEFNLNFDKTLFITDSVGDLKEAHKAGLDKSVGVTWGIHSRDILEKEKPFKIINNWRELHDL